MLSIIQKRDLEKYDLVHKMLYELIDCRRQIMSGTLPVDEIKEMKQHVTSKIDFTNRSVINANTPVHTETNFRPT